MENRRDYIARFINDGSMVNLFPDLHQRRSLAVQTFAEKWEAALVTVTKLNGDQFFID